MARASQALSLASESNASWPYIQPTPYFWATLGTGKWLPTALFMLNPTGPPSSFAGM